MKNLLQYSQTLKMFKSPSDIRVYHKDITIKISSYANILILYMQNQNNCLHARVMISINMREVCSNSICSYDMCILKITVTIPFMFIGKFVSS